MPIRPLLAAHLLCAEVEEVEAWVVRVAAEAASSRADQGGQGQDRSGPRLAVPQVSRMATTGAPEFALEAGDRIPAPGEQVRDGQRTSVSFAVESAVAAAAAVDTAAASPEHSVANINDNAEGAQSGGQQQSATKQVLPREYVMRRVKFQPGGLMIPEQPATDADKSRSHAGYISSMLNNQVHELCERNLCRPSEAESQLSPQACLERIWNALKMPEAMRLDFAIKYSSESHFARQPQVPVEGDSNSEYETTKYITWMVVFISIWMCAIPDHRQLGGGRWPYRAARAAARAARAVRAVRVRPEPLLHAHPAARRSNSARFSRVLHQRAAATARRRRSSRRPPEFARAPEGSAAARPDQ